MNNDFINALNVASFFVGLKNLQENLSQNDKQELMEKFDDQTRTLLKKVEDSVNEQNEMLRELLKIGREILRRIENG